MQNKKYLNINKDWKFKESDTLEIEDLTEKVISEFDNINLPHDWSIYKDFNQKSLSRNEGGLLDGGTSWYVRKINVYESFANKNIFIKFGGVYMDSYIYVNGALVGNYPFGYNTFTYDLTDYLYYGENTIAVKVTNMQPSSRWYSGSGIYRNVDLILREKIYIKNNGIVITTSNLESNIENAETNIELKLFNSSNYMENIKVKFELFDADGRIVKKSEVFEKIKKKSELNINETIFVENPKLWDIENPNLYYLKTSIYIDEKLMDEEFTRFGYRYFSWTREDGFSLNGKYLKLHGVCLHHDNGALGAELYEQADRRKLQIMKDMGVNAIRTSHNPQSEEFIKLCDEMGFLVQEESFDTWFGNRKKEYDYNRFFNKLATHPDSHNGEIWAEFDIKNMVRRDINSPSIVMWSIGNEIFETEQPYGVDQARNLIKWIKEIDETRYVTIGENSLNWNRNEDAHHVKIAGMLDTVGLNYNEDGSDELFERYPDWILYGAETSSAVKSRGVYYDPQTRDAIATGNANKPDRMYQMSDYGNDRVGWGRTAIDSWIHDRDRKYYAGQFIWTGFDYIGEPTPWHNEEDLGAPVKSSFFGIVDTAGLPKMDYYFYQSQWFSKNEKKIVKILPHWNFEDRKLLKQFGTDLKRDDNIIPVRVYSNIEKIELFLNGKSLGEKEFNKKTTDYGFEYLEGETKRDLYLQWFVPFEKGKLEAIAKDEFGNEIARDEVVTSENPKKVKLLIDENSQEGDLVYVRFDIVDKNDNVVPYANNLVEFEVTKNAQILGVDNGDASSQERYKVQKDGRWIRKAFSGSGMIIVQIKSDDIVVLKAESDKLESSEIELSLKPKKATFIENEILQLGKEISNIADGEILETKDIAVSIQKDQKLRLPEKVRVILENKFNSYENVNWNLEELTNIKKLGRYQVHGKTESGKNVIANINVNDFVSVENFSFAFRKGTKRPQLPKFATVYNTSGDMRKIQVVKWIDENTKEEIDFNNLKNTDNLVLHGILENSDFISTLNIRFVDNNDASVISSYNYARAWNGSEIPAGIASFTSDLEYTLSTTKALNNEVVSYDDTYIDRWTNISKEKRSEDWAGILFGLAGEFEQHQINKVEVFFFEDKEVSVPKEYKLEYYVTEKISFPKDYQNIETLEHELADDNNWKEIPNYTETIGEREKFKIFEFEDVLTHAIRVRMIAQDDKAIGITEIKAYGKEVKELSDYELNISVDGKALEFEKDKIIYEIPKDAKDVIVVATNNASVTKIPGITENEDITYIVKSENKLMENKYILRRKND
ncbi:glycoside hydrolase family 2 TIM barrel-domain containing protein [Helcococcus bovis]|uniref:glycoside hydrolase family 2 TIM barrel-domain containing protein n=1 Tax=Helcococcus bovis TaxID=3153252 RepID=UPI0038BBF6E3